MMLAIFLALQLHVTPVAPIAPTATRAPVADRWFGPDKVKHFLLAAFAQGVGYAALRSADVRHGAAQAGALTITIGLAIGKEQRDRRAYGHFSVRDLAWGVVGAATSAGILSRSAR